MSIGSADLAGVVQTVLEPAHVWVWISRPVRM